ncbi:DNA replication/repair protein RecF [Marinicrinis lubricantis]|uniref:DNA replication and repair protein RecF n=1 Tax=Marinicrinis lubricantis TaxID=2086470 RepID=A0ABW1IIM4_9BACL
MYLKQMKLQHYRNYGHIELEASPQVNIFIGPNAQGKTNLLESIYVLALTKSHRTHKDKELVQWNEERAIIQGELERRYGACRLDLMITNHGKKAKLNGLEQKKLSNYIGSLNVVMFAPEDLEIVKGSPSTRRRFLDMEIAQVYPGYVHQLGQFQKILAQRNQYLKQQFGKSNASSDAMLDIWNQQIAASGTKIMQKRQQFIYKLQKWADHIHSGITAGAEKLDIVYRPSFSVESFDDESMVFEQFMVKLTQMKEQEIRRGTTLVGPHRDDIEFFINDKEAHTYGSQGQQRTTALSVKLAEIELIHQEVGEYPILLLDDVLSELDRNRQTQLIETFQSKVQTFITTTGLESVNLQKLQEAKIFNVESGSIVSSGFANS